MQSYNRLILLSPKYFCIKTVLNMEADLKHLSKIVKRTKYTVHGWIRTTEKSSNLCTTPLLIISLCILYSREDEIFEIISDDVKLSLDKKSIHKTNNGFNWDNCSYGVNEILSTTNCIYEWILKIKANFKNYHQSGICIGISSTKNRNKDFSCLSDGFHYVYLNNGNKYQNNNNNNAYNWSNYCNSCGVNDKIGIYLD
eukprot:341603_1